MLEKVWFSSLDYVSTETKLDNFYARVWACLLLLRGNFVKSTFLIPKNVWPMGK